MKKLLLGLTMMISTQAYSLVECDQRGQSVKVELKKDAAGTDQFNLSYPYHKGTVAMGKPKKIAEGHYIFKGTAKGRDSSYSDKEITLEVNGGDYLSVMLTEESEEIPYFTCKADLLKLEEVSVKSPDQASKAAPSEPSVLVNKASGGGSR